jgi:methionyl-tRNA synthetase
MLVTSALPYANGAIHLGHLVEYIQTDIWVRFQKSQGHECYYVCADDAHGTPIMLKAQQEGMTPEALIARFSQEHQADFAHFQIGFDHYHSTHSPENRLWAETIFLRLREKGLIIEKEINQAYDPEAQMFLPDRFIRGTCPRCGARDQYGDSCEACGATYNPLDLIEARSAISGAVPVVKPSLHLFFDLAKMQDTLQQYLASSALQTEVANKLREWLSADLNPWDISRDAPYWGFLIPGFSDKYFYVWLDAPIGYMASFQALCAKKNIDFDSFWLSSEKTELYHFIGKDIIYFHGLFWPAMLSAAGLRLPTAIFAHGFLTVDGQKMSKSRGTFITAQRYRETIGEPDYLRYYFAAKLSAQVEDIDLNLQDFQQRVNSDLVGKWINLLSRSAKLLEKYHGGKLSDSLVEPEMYQSFVDSGESVAESFAQRSFSKAIREIMQLTDVANAYVDQHKPWNLAKDAEKLTEVQAICTQVINLFRVLAIYLQPVIPGTVAKVSEFLDDDLRNWEARKTPLLGKTLSSYLPLLQRVDAAALLSTPQSETSSEAKKVEADKDNTETAITLADFQKIVLRVAEVKTAETVAGAEKLLRLQVDLGEGRLRQIFSGIAKNYTPADLLGKKVLVVANLAPKKMRFGMSEGMLLTAFDLQGQPLVLFAPVEAAIGCQLQ